MSAPQTCPRKVWPSDAWSPSHVCGRPVKRDGLCGVHARVLEQRAARNARWDAQQTRHRAAREVARRFGEAFGVAGVGSSTSEITVPLDAAERLIAERMGGGS